MTTTTPQLVDRAFPVLSGNGQRPKPAGKLTAVMLLFGARVYLISPLDLIPDIIPFVCHVDDVGVIAAAIKYAKAAFGSSLV